MTKKILFVCTGNTCRSSMAQAIAHQLLKGTNFDIQVLSAGTQAIDGSPASRGALEALRDKGIDLSGHKSRLLTRDLVEEADIILTMTSSHKAYILDWVPEAKLKTFLLKEFALGNVNHPANLSIGDPYGQPVEVYKSVALELEDLIRKALLRIGQEEGK